MKVENFLVWSQNNVSPEFCPISFSREIQVDENWTWFFTLISTNCPASISRDFVMVMWLFLYFAGKSGFIQTMDFQKLEPIQNPDLFLFCRQQSRSFGPKGDWRVHRRPIRRRKGASVHWDLRHRVCQHPWGFFDLGQTAVTLEPRSLHGLHVISYA